MLESITVKNFKGIKTLEIEHLSKLTLIGGKNNCGKTSLMEAMFMQFDRMNPHITIRQSLARGVSVTPTEPEFMWAPIFNEFNLSKKIAIESKFNGKRKALEIEINKNFKKTIPGNIHSINGIQNNAPTPVDALTLKFFQASQEIEKSNLILEKTGFNLNIEHSNGSVMPSSFFPARQQSNPNEDAERLGRLEIENGTNDIVGVLKSIAPEIKSITAIRIADASMIYADIGQTKKVPISYMGDGISRLLSITLAIATCKNSVVFIDEIENGLHYSVLEKIWLGLAKASQRFNCQIIATTHSHEFLTSACNALKNEPSLVNEFSYIRLTNKNNNILGKYFDSKLLDFAIESEMEIR